MNRLKNPLKSVLEFFASFVGVVILALFFGVIGTLAHEYLGITLFLITFIAGTVGSIKNYLMPQSTS